MGRAGRGLLQADSELNGKIELKNDSFKIPFIKLLENKMYFTILLKQRGKYFYFYVDTS